ncbi:hypothetical protein [Blastococcus sp. PRF04-17]|uniref:hypothetical protein n=1 Tax=Blastococcus sp. PRF04-17 TaxID=2933797 RepID=UPI001FF24EA7|nr:hypothetical protein [Blastococcus sp. PRF04-17]UOY03262.1 hypothetical protein MVA48_07935 [Blastococcus sp. PRF04-17]
MTQPPGPYGPYDPPTNPNQPPPYPPQGQPPPYPPQGPPGTGPYGPPGGYPSAGPPPAGYPPPGYGPPTQPPKKGLLPWLIVGLAVLVSGVGVALVVLLTGKDDDPEPQAATSSSSPATSSSAEPTREATGDLPGGAQVAEPADDGGGRFEGSGDVALAWVQAMADGEFQTAYDLSCAEVQDAATSAAATNTGDPAWELGTYFFEQVLGGVGFTEGTFDSVEHQSASNTDMATFTLLLDDGQSFTLLVYVTPDLTVCDFF